MCRTMLAELGVLALIVTHRTVTVKASEYPMVNAFRLHQVAVLQPLSSDSPTAASGFLYHSRNDFNLD